MLRLSLGSHSIPGNTCIIISSSHHVGRGALWAENRPWKGNRSSILKWGVCGFVGTNVEKRANGVLKKTGYGMRRKQEIRRWWKLQRDESISKEENSHHGFQLQGAYILIWNFRKYRDVRKETPTTRNSIAPDDSVQFSRSVVSDSWPTHGLQHVRPPCPSPTPRVPNCSSPLVNTNSSSKALSLFLFWK